MPISENQNDDSKYFWHIALSRKNDSYFSKVKTQSRSRIFPFFGTFERCDFPIQGEGHRTFEENCSFPDEQYGKSVFRKENFRVFEESR